MSNIYHISRALATGRVAPVALASRPPAARSSDQHGAGLRAEQEHAALVAQHPFAHAVVIEAERVFRFAIDPGTYRTLTGELGLDDDGVREWMLRYERGMLLLRT